MKPSTLLITISLVILFSFTNCYMRDDELNSTNSTTLESYVQLNETIYNAIGCDVSFTAACINPTMFYALKNKDKKAYIKAVKQITKKIGETDTDIENFLTKELKNLKKNITQDENGNLDSYRENAYSFESLIKQLNINKIIELEAYIQSKQNSTDADSTITNDLTNSLESSDSDKPLGTKSSGDSSKPSKGDSDNSDNSDKNSSTSKK